MSHHPHISTRSGSEALSGRQIRTIRQKCVGKARFSQPGPSLVVLFLVQESMSEAEGWISVSPVKDLVKNAPVLSVILCSIA